MFFHIENGVDKKQAIESREKVNEKRENGETTTEKTRVHYQICNPPFFSSNTHHTYSYEQNSECERMGKNGTFRF